MNPMRIIEIIWSIVSELWNNKKSKDQIKNEVENQIKEVVKKESISSNVRQQKQDNDKLVEEYFKNG